MLLLFISVLFTLRLTLALRPGMVLLWLSLLSLLMLFRSRLALILSLRPVRFRLCLRTRVGAVLRRPGLPSAGPRRSTFGRFPFTNASLVVVPGCFALSGGGRLPLFVSAFALISFSWIHYLRRPLR